MFNPRLLAAAAAIAICFAGHGARGAPDVPAGTYTLDKAHASLVFRVSHLGFSNYTGTFRVFDATLYFDPAHPGRSRVTASVDVSSLTIPAPPDGFVDELLGKDWFDAAHHPGIAFESTRIESTGTATARVTGNVTFLGATLPLAFDVTFLGGYRGFAPYDPAARVGFIARGSLARSAFGMTTGLPPEGSAMGVGDEVTFRVDAEFNGPPLPVPDGTD